MSPLRIRISRWRHWWYAITVLWTSPATKPNPDLTGKAQGRNRFPQVTTHRRTLEVLLAWRWNQTGCLREQNLLYNFWSLQKALNILWSFASCKSSLGARLSQCPSGEQEQHLIQACVAHVEGSTINSSIKAWASSGCISKSQAFRSCGPSMQCLKFSENLPFLCHVTSCLSFAWSVSNTQG